MPLTTGFVPSVHGFRFPNQFFNLTPLGQFNGRCGGMCYAALDYFVSKRMPPIDRLRHNEVPPDSTTIANYIWNRQMDSMPFNIMAVAAEIGKNNDVKQFIDSQYAHGDGRAILLEQQVGGGTCLNLGLLGMKAAATGNHQVLCIGFDILGTGDDRMIAPLIYDPNHPGKIVSLTPDALGQCYKASLGGMKWRTWYIDTSYQHKEPPVVDGYAIRLVRYECTSPQANVENLKLHFEVEKGLDAPLYRYVWQCGQVTSGGTMFPRQQYDVTTPESTNLSAAAALVDTPNAQATLTTTSGFGTRQFVKFCLMGNNSVGIKFKGEIVLKGLPAGTPTFSGQAGTWKLKL